jgi:protein disulfide-isomerase A1
MKPIYIEAAQAMENDPDGTYIFGEANILTQEEIGKHFGIQSLPTILTFSPIDDYMPVNYVGPRTVLDIITGVEIAAGLTIRELPNYEEFQKRLELRDENMLLGLFKNDKNSLFEEMKKLKKDLKFVRMYYSFNVDDFKKNLKVKDEEEFILKIHRKKLVEPNEDLFVKYMKDKYSSLKDFVIEEYPYAIDYRTDKVNQIFEMRPRPAAVLFTPFTNRTEEVLSLAKQMKPLAQKYKGKFNIYVENSELRSSKLHRFNSNATYIIFDIDDDSSKYRYTDKDFDDQIDVNEYIKFTQLVLDGKAPKYIRSAIFNKDDLSLPVVTVIANSYNEVVKDPTKHVFIRYYDKILQRFEEQYKMRVEWYKVGRHYLNETRDDLIIAEIEVKDNDVPKYFLKQMTEKNHYYFLFKKGSKDKPIVYEGEVKAEKLIKFVEGHIGSKSATTKEDL